MKSPPRALNVAEVWRATLVTARRDLGDYLTIVAALVLLPAVAVALLGPGTPRTFNDVQGSALLLQGGLALLGGIAQLFVMRLAIVGGAPRDALRHGAVTLPRLVLAALLTAMVLVPAVMLLQLYQRGAVAALLPGLVLLIPGIYLLARLSLALPALSSTSGGAVAALRQSWDATAGNGWRVLGLIASIIGVLMGITLLTGAVAVAVQSTLTLLGGKVLGEFLVALISGAVGSLYTVYNSVALAEAFKRLAPARA